MTSHRFGQLFFNVDVEIVGSLLVVYMVFFAESSLPETHRCDVILRAILLFSARDVTIITGYA